MMPRGDLSIQNLLTDKLKQKPNGKIAMTHIGQHDRHKIMVFTDGSIDSETGQTGAAVYIP